jgi:hypothetical protein
MEEEGRRKKVEKKTEGVGIGLRHEMSLEIGIKLNMRRNPSRKLLISFFSNLSFRKALEKLFYRVKASQDIFKKLLLSFEWKKKLNRI